ncbi:hypothetical protein HDV00_011246 [Rhizophlyctis rosea]|nr:hypothetical protein HDV00_011246 [Rhizophlyctis rosea]
MSDHPPQTKPLSHTAPRAIALETLQTLFPTYPTKTLEKALRTNHNSVSEAASYLSTLTVPSDPRETLKTKHDDHLAVLMEMFPEVAVKSLESFGGAVGEEGVGGGY